MDPQEASDLYGAAAVAFFLLTGTPPYATEYPNTLSLMRALGGGKVKRPQLAGVELPSGLGDWLLHCLDADPGSRPDIHQQMARVELLLGQLEEAPKHADSKGEAGGIKNNMDQVCNLALLRSRGCP